jgi:hypothetical protein
MRGAQIAFILMLCAAGMSLSACNKSEAVDEPSPEPAESAKPVLETMDAPAPDPVLDGAMAAYKNWRHEILTGDGLLDENWQKDMRARWQWAQAETDPFLKELEERTALDQFPRMAQVWDRRTWTRIDELKGLQLEEDQLAAFGKLLIDDMAQTDASNLAWLKDIYEVRGKWFRISEVGERGASNAFLIVQHGTEDMFLMARVVADLERLYQQGESSGQHFAMMFDRVQMMAGKPQRYGSQLSCTDSKLAPHEIEDEFELDARRKDVGLMPMDEYLNLFGDLSC